MDKLLVYAAASRKRKGDEETANMSMCIFPDAPGVQGTGVRLREVRHATRQSREGREANASSHGPAPSHTNSLRAFLGFHAPSAPHGQGSLRRRQASGAGFRDASPCRARIAGSVGAECGPRRQLPSCPRATLWVSISGPSLPFLAPSLPLPFKPRHGPWPPGKRRRGANHHRLLPSAVSPVTSAMKSATASK